jgi:hypothetical protein
MTKTIKIVTDHLHSMSVYDDDESSDARRRRVLLDYVKGDLELVAPGQGGEAKAFRAHAVFAAFRTTSETEIANLPLAQLERGVLELRRYILAHGKDLTATFATELREWVAQGDALAAQAAAAQAGDAGDAAAPSQPHPGASDSAAAKPAPERGQS